MSDSKDTSVPSDVDIMMFLDGELSGKQANIVESYLADDEQAGLKSTALGQIGDFVRGSIELEADDAGQKLAGLWSGIDKAINANGYSKDSEKAALPSNAEERATQALVDDTRSGWFGGWQSHIATGAFVAVAVAVLMYTTRPERVVEKTTVRQVAPAPVQVVPVALLSQEPVVEELEVYNGSGVVMTITGDDGDDGGDSAVIWISDDTDLVEDPI